MKHSPIWFTRRSSFGNGVARSIEVWPRRNAPKFSPATSWIRGYLDEVAVGIMLVDRADLPARTAFGNGAKHDFDAAGAQMRHHVRRHDICEETQVLSAGDCSPRHEPCFLARRDGPQIDLHGPDLAAIGLAVMTNHAEHAAIPGCGGLHVAYVEDEMIDVGSRVRDVSDRQHVGACPDFRRADHDSNRNATIALPSERIQP